MIYRFTKVIYNAAKPVINKEITLQLRNNLFSLEPYSYMLYANSIPIQYIDIADGE